MSQAKTKVVLAFSDMNAKEYVDQNKHNCVYFDYVTRAGTDEEAIINAIKYNIFRESIDYVFIDLDWCILKRLMSEKIDFYLLFPYAGEDNYYLKQYTNPDIVGHYTEELIEMLYVEWHLLHHSNELERYRSAEMFSTTCRYLEYRDYNSSIASMMPRILLHKRITDTASN